MSMYYLRIAFVALFCIVILFLGGKFIISLIGHALAGRVKKPGEYDRDEDE